MTKSVRKFEKYKLKLIEENEHATSESGSESESDDESS